MEILTNIVASFLLLIFVAAALFMTYATWYGIYMSFQKKWYVGAASLLIPGFGLVVGLIKLVLKKNILEN